MYVSAQDCETNNRRIKRESKKLEEEKMLLQKKEASDARQKILDGEMNMIAKCEANGTFNQNCYRISYKKQQQHSNTNTKTGT